VTFYETPAYLIDPEILPSPIKTSDPDSFAYKTFKERVPGIIEETIALNTFPDEIQAALQALQAEIATESIRPLHEMAADREFWNALSKPYLGQSWFEVPWYWAEAFLYRRILEATCYFQPGPWHQIDPFDPKKATEWAPNFAPKLVEQHLTALPSEPQARFKQALYGSLWGNRIDLSYEVAVHLVRGGSNGDETANLLVDHSDQVWDQLQAQGDQHPIMIADNAGTELLMDLALVDLLLDQGLVALVDLHLKPQPFFVSDTMPKDITSALQALAAGGREAQALQQRLQGYLQARRLRLQTHWFYPTSLFYFQLPADLEAELAAADLVILKGDANYRRLLGDAHWSPTTSFEQITNHFPVPFAALRTLKAEVIAGLQPGQAEHLQQDDPNWLVNGRRGVSQGNF
jgi:hypothetical protein